MQSILQRKFNSVSWRCQALASERERTTEVLRYRIPAELDSNLIKPESMKDWFKGNIVLRPLGRGRPQKYTRYVFC